MPNKFTFARVAIITSAASFAIGAVTFANQHPFAWPAYLEAIFAVAVAAVGGYLIGRNQPDSTEPVHNVPK
ncbi:hypothetical protein GCM10027277_57580 [Pseudoduganella ginsengisoli]|uniref:Holin n=1 Tax=Pseudoduganella ginsengisoli TaxID=1462440 RepID=A0A6L6Q9K8_9BURK|nr:hypothetical protein [Pseudoduganella ginsengisoli]MTW05878.1 hypothetical protein [Pseudoduganella ginsengisoli]